ncbi:MAG: SDR family NAD(P)-dependent oxidoreductase [Candidatus Hodarchaeota archaeon]
MHNFMNWEEPGVAMVTGAAAGIGLEFAKQLASQDFDTILVDKQGQKLEALAKELSNKGGTHEALVADLSNEEDIKTVETRLRSLENLDVLVNNAGFALYKRFQDLDLSTKLDMLKVHNEVPVRFSHAGVKTMISRNRGIIINIASLAAFATPSPSSLYPPTKAFLQMFSEGLQVELRGTGVRVQALCPGFTRTELTEPFLHNQFENKGSHFPDSEWMTPEEVVQISLNMAKTKFVTVIPGVDNIDTAYFESKKLLRRLKRLEKQFLKSHAD